MGKYCKFCGGTGEVYKEGFYPCPRCGSGNKKTERLRLIMDCTAMNKGQMSVMFFADKWKLPYKAVRDIAYEHGKEL